MRLRLRDSRFERFAPNGSQRRSTVGLVLYTATFFLVQKGVTMSDPGLGGAVPANGIIATDYVEGVLPFADSTVDLRLRARSTFTRTTRSALPSAYSITR